MATCQGTRHNNTIYRCSVGEFYKKVLGRSATAKCEPCSTGSCVYFVAVFVLVSLVIGFLFISEGLVDDSDKKRKRELAAAKKLYEKCKLSSLESMDDYQNNSYELSDLQFLRIHRFVLMWQMFIVSRPSMSFDHLKAGLGKSVPDASTLGHFVFDSPGHVQECWQISQKHLYSVWFSLVLIHSILQGVRHRIKSSRRLSCASTLTYIVRILPQVYIMIHMLFYPVALMQLTIKSGTNWIDGLPFIIILIVIPPILVFVHIIRQPERLRNAKVLETWGFVYIGFRQNRIFLFLLLDFATMVMFVATRYIYPYNLDLSALTEAIANQKARMFANFCILWVTTLLHKHFKPFVSERMNKDTTGLHKALSTMYVVSFACLSTDLATCNGATLAVSGVMYWLCNFFVAIFYPLYYLGDYYFYGAFSRRRMKFRQSLKVTEIVDARAIGDVDDDVQIESDSLIVFRGEEDIKLGGGGGGNVFLATLDGHKVAVKELINMDAIGVEEMNAEVRNMKQARHPAIIYLYGTCFVPSRSNLGIDHHYIVMELADRGSLEGCLLEQKQLRIAEYEKNPQHFSDYQDAMARSDFPLTVMNVLNWARDIVSGFHFLYLKGIAHRDIKPDNIFLAKDYSAKIGDLGFGMKKKEGLTDSMPTVLRRTSNRNEDSRRDTEVDGGVGTLPYMAPEAFQKTLDRDDLEKADVWSFGVMLARICTLEEPFNPSINHRALRGQIRDGVPRGTLRPFEYLGDRMFFPPATPANLEKYYVHEGLLPIIKECLNHNPDSRPSFKNLKDILTKIHEQAHHTIQQAKSDLVEVALEDTPIMAQKSSTTSTALGQSSSSLRKFSFIELISSGESSRKNGAEEPLMP